VNRGPLIFLAAFFALASSWSGFVLAPQFQIGRLQQTNSVPSGATYPLARPGLARQGLEVYRANGCAYCHSQQVGQTGTVCDVILTDAGTNQTALLAALHTLRPVLPESEARQPLGNLPKSIRQDVSRPVADADVKTLNATGAKASVWIVPVGPDIPGWGKRHSVAEDFLFDNPVMLGSQRIGPDMANAGVRQPDPNWHLRHLYAPTAQVKGSTMPPYRFLFVKRKIERVRSPDALSLPAELALDPAYEIVPLPEANALVAYLLSLRADAPLFVAPVSVASLPSANTSTNTAPAPNVSTNAAAAKPSP
jgi:cbb3-type cytochrome oxidase cytochrome c subunit